MQELVDGQFQTKIVGSQPWKNSQFVEWLCERKNKLWRSLFVAKVVAPAKSDYLKLCSKQGLWPSSHNLSNLSKAVTRKALWSSRRHCRHQLWGPYPADRATKFGTTFSFNWKSFPRGYWTTRGCVGLTKFFNTIHRDAIVPWWANSAYQLQQQVSGVYSRLSVKGINHNGCVSLPRKSWEGHRKETPCQFYSSLVCVAWTTYATREDTPDVSAYAFVDNWELVSPDVSQWYRPGTEQKISAKNGSKVDMWKVGVGIQI